MNAICDLLALHPFLFKVCEYSKDFQRGMLLQCLFNSLTSGQRSKMLTFSCLSCPKPVHRGHSLSNSTTKDLVLQSELMMWEGSSKRHPMRSSQKPFYCFRESRSSFLSGAEVPVSKVIGCQRSCQCFLRLSPSHHFTFPPASPFRLMVRSPFA